MDEDRKDIQAAQEASVQPRATEPIYGGLTGLMRYLSAGSYRVAPWWSPQRDSDLSTFMRDSDHVSSSLSMLISKVSTVPVKVMPRDNRIRRHQEDAEQFNIILNEEAEYGQLWMTAVSKWLQDYWTTDNGAFFEIIGGGKKDGPIKGPALGIAHLDSFRCERRGDPDYPVMYYPPTGKQFKLHRTRVAYTSDMPSAREEMLGIGFCAISRLLNNAQVMMDILNFKQEKLGSRPHRGILVGRGISTDTIISALKIANKNMDSKGLGIYAQLAILGDIAPEAALELVDLISLPDGFDEEQSVLLGMFLMALSFNVPIRWLWPAATSGATKADAMYQHIAGLGGGVGKVLYTLTMLLGGDPRGMRHSAGKFLPSHLKIVFDFQDDEQDRSQAEIRERRATTRNANLETGVITERVAREHALESSDITQSQFDTMELESGRLPGGEPVMSLFLVDKEPFLSWLDLGVPNPLAISVNEPIDMLAEIDAAAVRVQDVLANSSIANKKAQAEMALAALNQLKQQYAPLAQQSIQSDIMARLQGSAPVEPTPTEQVEEEAEKSFDYGASVGEIIGGELARGIGGRFVSAQEMMEQIKAGMIARMRGAASDVSTNSAASKRAANRARIAEAMGIDPGLLDGLAGMKTGEASQEQMQQLAAMGFAEVQPNGDITMTAAGRSMLGAVNSGDVDSAKIARAKAQQPKAGGGSGKAPKQTAEQRAAQREEEARQQRERNVQMVSEAIGTRLPQDDFGALDKFNKGDELAPDEQQRLAQAGLVEIDADGNARMTSYGSRLMAAAEKGDVRAAKDTLSAAADKVRATQEKAESYRSQADAVETAAQEAITTYTEQARVLQQQGDVAIEGMRQQASDLNQQADAMQAEIDSTLNRDERQALVEEQDNLRQRAIEIEQLAQDTRAQIDDRIMAYTEEIDRIREKSVGQAESYRELASRLESTIGGGLLPEQTLAVQPQAADQTWTQRQTENLREILSGQDLTPEEEDSLIQRILKRGLPSWLTSKMFKKKQGFVPQGKPLKRAEITPEMILALEQDAIDEWNAIRDLPEGILEAKQQ